jgi:hypothetical protein
MPQMVMAQKLMPSPLNIKNAGCPAKFTRKGFNSLARFDSKRKCDTTLSAVFKRINEKRRAIKFLELRMDSGILPHIFSVVYIDT